MLYLISMLNRALLFTATFFCFLSIAWGLKGDPHVPERCNILMGQFLNHYAKSGALRESKNFLSSTIDRFPNVFESRDLYPRELSEAFRGSHFVKDLGFDESQARQYLFEGEDSFGRIWQFTFKVTQGNMTLDGELVSANPKD